MVFFHFVEPDHWYYTHGPSYLDTIRAKEKLGKQIGTM